MSELKGILTERETLIGTLSLGADYYKGETGNSGVFLGDEPPVDEEITVWIAPEEGGASDIITQEKLEEALESIEVDLTDYYTKEQVNEAIANIDIPEVDLSSYATKEEIPDVSGFQTAEQVQTAITTALSAIGVAEEGAY